MLRVLVHAQQGAETLTVLRVAAYARLPLERCEATLDALVRGGWIAQTADGRWLLACDPDVVMVAEIYDSLGTADARGARFPGAVEALLATSAAGVRAALAVPLSALADPQASDAAARPSSPRRARR